MRVFCATAVLLRSLHDAFAILIAAFMSPAIQNGGGRSSLDSDRTVATTCHTLTTPPHHAHTEHPAPPRTGRSIAQSCLVAQARVRRICIG